MLKIVNLTNHKVNVISDTGVETFLPSGKVVRCTEMRREINVTSSNVPMYDCVYGDPTELPPERPDTMYIVSELVARCSKRRDLVIPGDIIRDRKGTVVACKSLNRVFTLSK